MVHGVGYGRVGYRVSGGPSRHLWLLVAGRAVLVDDREAGRVGKVAQRLLADIHCAGG